MPITFLNITLAVESSEELDHLQRLIKDDIEKLYAPINGTVFSVTWDRDSALAYNKANADKRPYEVITHERKNREAITEDVAQICEKYNWTLRKPKKGGPPWRVVDYIGEVEGLSHLRGKVVLTDGILAMMVLPENRWIEIHWRHFLPDAPEELEDDLKHKPKGPTKLQRFFAFKSDVDEDAEEVEQPTT